LFTTDDSFGSAGLKDVTRVFGQSWQISVLSVEGLRDVELSERDSHLFVVREGFVGQRKYR